MVLLILTEPVISWSVDGVPVISRVRGSVDVAGNGRKLRVLRARSEDSNIYTCTASNSAGITTAQVTLDVQCKFFKCLHLFSNLSVGHFTLG